MQGVIRSIEIIRTNFVRLDSDRNSDLTLPLFISKIHRYVLADNEPSRPTYESNLFTYNT